MSRTRRPLGGLALIALAPVISACGSSAPAGSGSDNSTLAHAQEGVKFAACMRSHGVSNFPDP